MAESGNSKGWTFDSFQHYLEAMFIAHGEALRVALAANEKRLDGMNEFRGAMGDRERDLMPRNEADIRLATQAADIAALKTTSDSSKARAQGMSAGAKVAVGLVSMLVGLLGLFVAGITVAGVIYALLHK
jgi:hypothetical protein